MGNSYVWSTIFVLAIATYLKWSYDKQLAQETDLEFLSRKLAAFSQPMLLLGVLVLVFSLIFVWVGFARFSEQYWMAIGGLAGLAAGWFLLRPRRPTKIPPIVQALQTDPDSVSDLKITAFRFGAMRTSETAQLTAQRKVGTAYLADEKEKHRFLRILHEMAPHLVSELPAAPDASPGKQILKSVASVFYVLLVILVIVVLRIYFKNGKSSGTQDFRSAMKDYAEEVNASLPAMIDEQTRLDSVALRAGGFFHNYTIINATLGDIDRQEFKRIMIARLTQSACADAPSKTMIDNDYPVSFVYHDASGIRFATITISDRECDRL